MTNILPKFGAYLTFCDYPVPSTTDLAAWGTVANTATTTNVNSVVKVGLFGYDTSCLLSLCAEEDDFASLCSVLDGLGLDGWSIGVSVKKVAADTGAFNVVQNVIGAGDIMFLPYLSG